MAATGWWAGGRRRVGLISWLRRGGSPCLGTDAARTVTCGTGDRPVRTGPWVATRCGRVWDPTTPSARGVGGWYAATKHLSLDIIDKALGRIAHAKVPGYDLD